MIDVIVLLFVLTLLSWLVYCDAVLLRRRAQISYDAVMKFPPIVWGLGTPLLLAVALPFYLVLRQKWRKEAGSVLAFNPVSDALGVALQWFCGVLYFMIALKGLAFLVPELKQELMEMIISIIFSSGWIIFLIYKTARHYPGFGFKEAIAWRKPKPSFLKAALGAAALGVFFAVVSSYILVTRPESPSTPLSEALEANQSSLLMVIFLVLAVMVAPLVEEIIFRGYLFGVLDAARGRTTAIVVVALLFGLMHMDQYWGDWEAIALVTLLGLAMTIVRSLTGSVIASVITHYVYNGLVTVLPVVILGYR